MILIQHIKTNNDNNGNPRRLFLVMDSQGSIIEAIDEGYQGRGAVRAKGYDWDKVVQLPEVETTVSEYKNFLKNYSKKS